MSKHYFSVNSTKPLSCHYLKKIDIHYRFTVLAYVMVLAFMLEDSAELFRAHFSTSCGTKRNQPDRSDTAGTSELRSYESERTRVREIATNSAVGRAHDSKVNG